MGAPYPPDFLLGLVRSTHFMRLSLQKAAHATMGGAAYRKSGSERALCARCGIPRTSTVRPKDPSRLGVSTRGRKMTRRAQWYPTSDQKRVRYGAPGVHLLGENSKEGFFTSSGANVGHPSVPLHRCFRQLKHPGCKFFLCAVTSIA
jgi:hypothetical protein